MCYNGFVKSARFFRALRTMHLPPRGPSNSFKLLHLPASSARRINATHPVTFSPYFLCVSSLDATLMTSPASVANKRLTVELNPLDATLTKNRGWKLRPVYTLPVPSRSLPAPSRPQRFDQRPRPCRKEPVPSIAQNTSRDSPVTAHIPLSTTEQSTSSSVMYIVPVLSSPLCVRGIARSFCVGGCHEQSIEDCLHRRRRVDRSCSCRAVFDSRQSVPPHH